MGDKNRVMSDRKQQIQTPPNLSENLWIYSYFPFLMNRIYSYFQTSQIILSFITPFLVFGYLGKKIFYFMHLNFIKSCFLFLNNWPIFVFKLGQNSILLIFKLKKKKKF